MQINVLGKKLSDDEELIWCKQSLLRVTAYCSLLRDSALDELCAMLNDIEGDEKDIEAISFLVKAIEVYKE